MSIQLTKAEDKKEALNKQLDWVRYERKRVEDDNRKLKDKIEAQEVENKKYKDAIQVSKDLTDPFFGNVSIGTETKKTKKTC